MDTPISRVDVFERAVVRLTPYVFVTWVVLALNVVVFGGMLLDGASIMSPTRDQLIEWGANQGVRTAGGEWWRLTTSNFVHIGILHIAFNMWVLVSAGPLVERLIGNAPFAATYLFAGALGSIASMMFRPMVVSAGASGAVFGVFGALLAVVLRQKGSIPMERVTRLRNSALTFVMYNVAFGLSMPGIDNAAHFGGLVGGFLAGAVSSRPIIGEVRRSAWPRALLVVVLGAGAIFGATRLVPPSLDALRHFITMEEDVDKLVRDHAERFDAGQLDGLAFAAVLDDDIIPRWHEARVRLQKSGAKDSEKIISYAVLREEALGLLSRGLREDDADYITAYKQKQAEAVKALE
jgi:rhomboid protease GluP